MHYDKALAHSTHCLLGWKNDFFFSSNRLNQSWLCFCLIWSLFNVIQMWQIAPPKRQNERDWYYLANVFLLVKHSFLPLLHYLSSYIQHTRILNFLSISHISMLVGNSINFPRSSYQQLGLSNLGIFILQALAQCGEYTGMSWQGVTNILSVCFYSPLWKIVMHSCLQSGPSAKISCPMRLLVAHPDLCNSVEPRWICTGTHFIMLWFYVEITQKIYTPKTV